MFEEWTIELKGMANRIISMRQQLFNALNIRGICQLLRFLFSGNELMFSTE